MYQYPTIYQFSLSYILVLNPSINLMHTTKNVMIKLEPPECAFKGKLVPLRHTIITKNKAQNHTQVRDEFASRKIFNRWQESLPQIQSPYLKKTVTNLFPFSSCQITPTKVQQKTHFEKYSLSILDERIRIGTKAQKIFNSAGFVDETHQQDAESRMIKSLSETKTNSKLLSEQSCNAIIAKPKIITQNSSLSLPRYLSNKQAERIIKQKGSVHLRQSPFVLKHKLAHSLYSQQRADLKAIQDILASRQAKSMGKSLKVKNYTKFAPNIINILS